MTLISITETHALTRCDLRVSSQVASQSVLVGRCSLQPTTVKCVVALQAETAWKAAAVQLEALTETHSGVLHQLKEAQERTQLAEQETIEVSRLAHFSLSGTLSDVLAGLARWQLQRDNSYAQMCTWAMCMEILSTTIILRWPATPSAAVQS